MDSKEKIVKNWRWDLISKYRTQIMGIAILWVMLYHCNEAGMVLPKKLNLINFILENGRTGVEIFLFLSGFGLYYSFTKTPDVKAFYKKRVLRVVIPYILIATPFWAIQDLFIHRDIAAFFKNATLISFWTDGYIRLWYFAILIPLYFVFPFLYRWVFKKDEDRSAVVKTLSLIALVTVVVLVTRHFWGEFYGNIEIGLTRIPIFLLGILAGRFSSEKKELTFNGLALFLILYSYGMYIFEYNVKGFKVRYWGIFLGIAVCVVSVYFLEIWTKVIRGKTALLSLAGKYSLELYITHIWVRRFFIESEFDYKFIGFNWNKYGILEGLLIVLFSILLSFAFVKLEEIVMKKLKLK